MSRSGPHYTRTPDEALDHLTEADFLPLGPELSSFFFVRPAEVRERQLGTEAITPKAVRCCRISQNFSDRLARLAHSDWPSRAR